VAIVVVAPLVEELAKLAAVWKAMWRDPARVGPDDGAIHAACGALGFAFVENLGYFAGAGPGTVIIRSLLSIPGHVLFSIFWGAPLGRAKTVPSTSRAALYRGLATAVLFHGLFNALAVRRGDWLGMVVLLLVMGLFQYHLLRRISQVHSVAAAVFLADPPTPAGDERGVDIEGYARALFARLAVLRFRIVGASLACGVVAAPLVVAMASLVSRHLVEVRTGELMTVAALAALLGAAVFAGQRSGASSVLEVSLGIGLLGPIGAAISRTGTLEALGAFVSLALVGAFGAWIGLGIQEPDDPADDVEAPPAGR
jgi:hypothetical protein